MHIKVSLDHDAIKFNDFDVFPRASNVRITLEGIRNDSMLIILQTCERIENDNPETQWREYSSFDSVPFQLENQGNYVRMFHDAEATGKSYLRMDIQQEGMVQGEQEAEFKFLIDTTKPYTLCRLLFFQYKDQKLVRRTHTPSPPYTFVLMDHDMPETTFMNLKSDLDVAKTLPYTNIEGICGTLN